MAIGTSTALLGGAALSAGGSLLGGLMGGGGGSGQMWGAANQAYLNNQHQAEVTRSDASPWTSSGKEALNELGGLIGWGSLSNPGTNGSLWTYGGDPTGGMRAAANSKLELFKNNLYGTKGTFEADPGYAWRVAEGNKALDRSAAAKGGLYSGGQLKALTNWNQDYATNEYGNWWQRNKAATDNYLNLLTGMSGQGANVQSGVNSNNTSLAQGQGNYLMNAGQYGSQSADNASRALASGIGAAGNNLLTAGLYMGMPGWGGGTGGGYSSDSPAASVGPRGSTPFWGWNR